jgi:hypothetical protein
MGSQTETRLIGYMTRYIEQHQDHHVLLDQESHIILTALETAHALSEYEIYLQALITLFPYLRSSKPYNMVRRYLQQAYWYARTAGQQTASLLRIASYLVSHLSRPLPL